MSRSVHEQARELIAAGAQDLPAEQQGWLRRHLRECAECRDYTEAAGRVVDALRGQPLAADSALVEATQLRVRSRALELRQRQQRTWLVCLSCLLVGLSATITTPLLWGAFAWLGSWAGVASWVWQASFTVFWMAPALAVSLFLLAHGTHLSNNGEKQWR